MASAQTELAKFFANNKVTMYDDDDATAATAHDVGWVDMQEYQGIAILSFASALTGTGAATLEIHANSESDGSGTDATVVSRTGLTAADAVGDWFVLECTAEQIRAVETSSTGQLRYVTLSTTCNNNADEQVVVYIRHGCKFPRAALTADYAA